MSLPVFSNPPAEVPLWERRWAGPAVVAAAFLAMLVWTWQKWADVLVDFGVQLYVPWQLAQGKVLYRDIAHYTGPISVYYNALAFRAFGANLRVLELANLPILIGIVMAIYWLACRLGGRLCAVVCATSFVTLFALAHLTIAGNYNFVCPYEYEYTHATLLSLGCVIFLHRLVTGRRIVDSAIAGFLAGLIFLTRSEFFVAAIAAAVVAMGLLATIDIRALPAAAAAFVLAAALPPLISACLLHLAMPWTPAIHGTLGMWPALLNGSVSAQRFYQHSMGLDDVPRSLRLLSAWCAAWCIPMAGFAAWAAMDKSRRSTWVLCLAFFVGAIFAGWQWRHRDWPSMFRPLPVVAAAVVVVAIIRFIRRRDQSDQSALAAILGIFSLVLLGKVFLYARIIHYGCWLAMPATMMLLIGLFGWVPAALRRLGGCADIFLAGVGGAWTVVLLVHLAITHTAMKQLTVSVGTGADQFWADPIRGNCVNKAVLAAEQIIPADKSLACFPEGIAINYLARVRTATPYVNFNPPDLLLFGEDGMLEALKKSPPDYVLLVHKDTSEFGERFFGRDYGRKLYTWIEDNYRQQPLPMLDLGAEPLRDERFGIRLLIPRRPGEEQRRLIYGPAETAPADSTSSSE
ncbi:MAG: hypothetical protein ABSC42_10420 [Tepidisphaeraceae bacterium]|jgi:hypothetical protein